MKRCEISMMRTCLGMTAILLLSGAVQAGGFTGKAYEVGSRLETVLFSMEQTRGADGLSSVTVFNSTDGKSLATEKMEYDSAGNPSRYSVDHVQSGTSGVVEVKGAKLVFTYHGPNGKVKTSEEKLPELWASGPMVTRAIMPHRMAATPRPPK